MSILTILDFSYSACTWIHDFANDTTGLKFYQAFPSSLLDVVPTTLPFEGFYAPIV